MKKLILFLSLFWTASFSYVCGQDNSYSIPLDSAYVINNAVVMRAYGNAREYVMMPTQYGTNIATGKPLIVVVNSSLTGNVVSIYRISGLDGLVVNDMALGSNNLIYFGGYRLGKAVYGIIDATFSNINVIYDESSQYCKAIAYKNLSGTSYLFTGDQCTANTARLSSFYTAGGALNHMNSAGFADALSEVDVSLSQHSTLATTYGISIGRFDSRHLALFKNNLSNLQTSTSSKRKVDLPQYWQWHEGGGSVERIDNDTYVAVIDVRCDTAEKDGVWLVKFKMISTTMNIIATRLIEFPTQKVIVKDLCYVDTKGGKKLCVAGQYVDMTPSSSWNGCPFIMLIDTNFTNEKVKLYATHYPQYWNRNFTLNKMCYNMSVSRLVAVGSYWSYLPTYPTGGIYLATSNVFSNSHPQYSCVENLNVTNKVTVRSYGTINGMSTMCPQWSLNVDSASFDTIKPISLDCVPVMLPETKSVSMPSNQHCNVTENALVFHNIDGIVDFVIYDITGKKVKQGSASSSINISSLHKGAYIIQISQNKQIVATEKFVK